jgi:hypothetical protein
VFHSFVVLSDEPVAKTAPSGEMSSEQIAQYIVGFEI